jgi:hypothetical protein
MNNKYGLSFVVSSSLSDAIFAQRTMNTALAVRNNAAHSIPPMAIEASFALDYMFNNKGFYNVFSVRTPFTSEHPILRGDQQLTGFASALHDEKTGIYSISHMYTVPSPHYSGTGLLENLLLDARGHKARTIRIWAENDAASENYREKGFKPYTRDKSGKMDLRYLELKEDLFEKTLKKWKKISQTPYVPKSKSQSLNNSTNFSL